MIRRQAEMMVRIGSCGDPLSDACRRAGLNQGGWGARRSCLDSSASASNLRHSSTFQNAPIHQIMHLLNTSTLKLKDFIKAIPDYAILSHTWNDEEVTFDDIDKPHAVSMKGYEKISRSCKQALKDGFEWIWVDTCCIDKKSSAELSEAINSMYDWYWRAEVCYAYLEDVQDSSEPVTHVQFSGSRWFRRGWTLQELLAPGVVEFYSATWSRLGTKSSLAKQIEKITCVDSEFLLDRRTISTAWMGTKLGWAAFRETTREEDIAYCLLGLVQVNMPMLYGEGPRAFYRLQLEILKQTRDHTVFTWEPGLVSAGPLKTAAKDQWGLLAPSPDMFGTDRASALTPFVSHEELRQLTHEMTNIGIRLTLPCIRQNDGRVLAILSCQDGYGRCIGVPLQENEHKHYARIPGSILPLVTEEMARSAELVHMYVTARTSLQVPKSIFTYNLHVARVGIWDVPDGVVDVDWTSSILKYEQQVQHSLSNPTEQERHRFGPIWSLRETISKSIELTRGSFGIVTFKIGHILLAMVVGRVEDFPWLTVLSSKQSEGLALQLEQLLLGPCRFDPADERWKHTRDHFRDTLEPDIGLEVSIRKTRSLEDLGHATLWPLSVAIWDARKSKPDESSLHRLTVRI